MLWGVQFCAHTLHCPWLQASHSSLVQLASEKSKGGTEKAKAATASLTRPGAGQPVPLAAEPRAPASSMQQAIDAWHQAQHLVHLRTCLEAAGHPVPVAAGSQCTPVAPPRVTKAADACWYLVVPVALSQPSSPAAQPHTVQPVPSQPCSTLVSPLSAPQVEGQVDWGQLVQLAQGLQPLQHIIDLGPCALPSFGASLRPPAPAAAPSSHNPFLPAQAQQGSNVAADKPTSLPPLAAALEAALPQLQGRMLLPCFNTRLRCTHLELALTHSPPKDGYTQSATAAVTQAQTSPNAGPVAIAALPDSAPGAGAGCVEKVQAQEASVVTLGDVHGQAKAYEPETYHQRYMRCGWHQGKSKTVRKRRGRALGCIHSAAFEGLMLHFM